MELHLDEIMTRDPVTARPTDPLAAATAAMRARGVGSAVVVAGDTVAGILTERDVARAVAAGIDPRTAAVDAWMTPRPTTGAPGDELTAALDRMLDHGFRHLPVLDGGVLRGVVSLRQLVRAASLRRVDPWSPGTARGLENVRVGETCLSHVDGARGRLLYAGYDATALARRRTFEEVWHLLHRGSLPADGGFARGTRALRALPLERDRLRAIACAGGTFMARLQAAVAATGAAWNLRPWHEREVDVVAGEAVRLAGVIGTLVAALWRLEHDLEPVDPDPALPFAANYLWMLHGRRPTGAESMAAERYLVLTADHGMNASTFTARVVASTGADVAAAVAAAVGALSGPLHGGAPSLVLDMLDEIGTAERAGDWIAAAMAAGRRIMGFGHRVYRTEDPRAACLRETAEGLGGERIRLARAVENAALAALRAGKPGRELHTNVEFYAAVVLEAAGIPRALFTPTFATARAIGWTAHVVEQVRDNRLIRPSVDYLGPVDRVVP
jgi:citrate synthase